MKSNARRLIGCVAVMPCLAATLNAAQRGWLREHVRTHGDINRQVISCGPPTGLKEIVAHTQLTVGGLVSRVESALHEDERDDYVYTDYVIEVTRAFRLPNQSAIRLTPGATQPSPFVAGPPMTRPAATTLRVRLRARFHGRVAVDGGAITDNSGFPRLHVGQHVILSGYFSADTGQWEPFGAFEVREGRVVHLDAGLQTRDYESVEEFAAALANPPPTVER
jgi:hypothetical protein